MINQECQIVHTWKGPFDAMSQDTLSRVALLIGSNSSTDDNTSEDSSVTSLSNQQEQNQVTSSSSYETIGYPVAFVAGVLSFLSPCILPLIPSYVAFITGMSMEELSRNRKNTKSERDMNASGTGSDQYAPNSRTDKPEVDELSLVRKQSPSQLSMKHTAIVRGLLFIAGFSLVFISLGASITAIGAAFSDYTVWIERVGGILLVIFGLNLLGVLKIPVIQRDWAIHFSKRPIAGHLGSFVIGMGFGAGWTPCIGPILASILTIAASSSSIMTGVNLLAVYSAGLAIPFIISTIAIERFLIAFRKFRKWLPWVNRASAAMLIIIGIILITGFLTLITSTLSGFQMP
jgi:cytochrome c-type biogenesis protein